MFGPLLMDIFWTFMLIGTFSFGGGNAMYPLLYKELVQLNGWLTEQQLVDLFAFAQMTPGPVATNAATFVGFKLGGLAGSVVATVGVSIPSAVIMLIVVRFVTGFNDSPAMQSVLAGLRPVVVSLILGAGIIITMQSIRGAAGGLLIAGSFAAARYFGVHPILVIIISGFIGIIVY